MLSAARSQSLSTLTTCAGERKPPGNSTVIGPPTLSRTTCQLVTTRPNCPRASTSVPLPYDTAPFSGTVIRATAGWGGCAGDAAGALWADGGGDDCVAGYSRGGSCRMGNWPAAGDADRTKN